MRILERSVSLRRPSTARLPVAGTLLPDGASSKVGLQASYCGDLEVQGIGMELNGNIERFDNDLAGSKPSAEYGGPCSLKTSFLVSKSI